MGASKAYAALHFGYVADMNSTPEPHSLFAGADPGCRWMYLLMYMALNEGVRILVLRRWATSRKERESPSAPSLETGKFYTHRVFVAAFRFTVILPDMWKDDSALESRC